MKIEHIAFNVENPPAAADWYVENLAMKLVREGPPPVNARFLADDKGAVVLEFYCNPAARVGMYRDMSPAELHLAFLSNDLAADAKSLIAAGAKPAGEIETLPNNDVVIMLRDPWGLALQLVKRIDNMIDPRLAK